jgi:hypothetical protein
MPAFFERTIDKSVVVFYSIEIYNNYSKNKWTLEKRYSDFENLRKSIEKLIPNMPALPGKTFFKVKSYDGLNKRRSQLEKFLKDCVARKDIICADSFREFLEIERNSPDLSVNAPTKISEFIELPMGVRDFIYLKYQNIIFMACSDMNLVSRVDAYVTNVNLPWEKKTDAHISVGAAFAYRVTCDFSNNYNFEKVWAKSYPKQVKIN